MGEWTAEREAEVRALLEGMEDGRWQTGVSPYRWYSRAESQADLRDALDALAREREAHQALQAWSEAETATLALERAAHAALRAGVEAYARELSALALIPVPMDDDPEVVARRLRALLGRAP